MSQTAVETMVFDENTGKTGVHVMDVKSTAQAMTTSNAENAQQNKKQRKAVSDLHPKYSQMISEAITSLKERNGSSRQAILKYILTSYNVSTDKKLVNNHVKMSLKAGVKSGKLKQSKGSGACGSYKLGKVISKKASKLNQAGSNSQVKKASLTKVKKPQDVSKISKATAKKTISNKTSVNTKSSTKKTINQKMSSKTKSSAQKTNSNKVSSKTKSSAKKTNSNKASKSSSQKSKSSLKKTVQSQKVQKQAKGEKAIKNSKKSRKSGEAATKNASQTPSTTAVA